MHSLSHWNLLREGGRKQLATDSIGLSLAPLRLDLVVDDVVDDGFDVGELVRSVAVEAELRHELGARHDVHVAVDADVLQRRRLSVQPVHHERRQPRQLLDFPLQRCVVLRHLK